MHIPLCVVFNCYVVFKSDKNEDINQVNHMMLYGIYLGECTTGNGHLILQVSSSNIINKDFRWGLTNNNIAWFWWILLWEGKTCHICMLGRLVVLSRMVKAWNPQTIHIINVTTYIYHHDHSSIDATPSPMKRPIYCSIVIIRNLHYR